MRQLVQHDNISNARLRRVHARAISLQGNLKREGAASDRNGYFLTMLRIWYYLLYLRSHMV